jgi:RNA polymerase sigma-70 factor (ECF subfamily)
MHPTPGIPRATEARPFALDTRPQDKARLSAALSEHYALVWRSLRRFGVLESVVDDAAQHVFLTFAERLEDVEPDRERNFLIAVSVRVAANARRLVERAREVPLDDAQSELETGLTPEELLVQKQRRLVLEAALATLSLDQRVVFVLFELEGFSLPEIAESVGIPVGTATSRLRRARQHFESWVSAHRQAQR